MSASIRVSCVGGPCPCVSPAARNQFSLFPLSHLLFGSRPPRSRLFSPRTRVLSRQRNHLNTRTFTFIYMCMCVHTHLTQMPPRPQYYLHSHVNVHTHIDQLQFNVNTNICIYKFRSIYMFTHTLLCTHTPQRAKLHALACLNVIQLHTLHRGRYIFFPHTKYTLASAPTQFIEER